MNWKIEVDFGPFIKGCRMIIQVPENEDTEEYIDSYLDFILNDDLRYNCDFKIMGVVY